MSVSVDIIVLINVLRIALRAFLRPGFLRSTLRESRVRSPARFVNRGSLGLAEKGTSDTVTD